MKLNPLCNKNDNIYCDDKTYLYRHGSVVTVCWDIIELRKCPKGSKVLSGCQLMHWIKKIKIKIKIELKKVCNPCELL